MPILHRHEAILEARVVSRPDLSVQSQYSASSAALSSYCHLYATFHASSTTDMGHTHTGVQHPKLLRLRGLHRRSSLGNNRWRIDPQMETTSTTSNNNIPIGRTGKSLEAQDLIQRGDAVNIWRGVRCHSWRSSRSS